MLYGIALKEKQAPEGLNEAEILELFQKLVDPVGYPIEIEAKSHECSAMGFIAKGTAEKLNYDYGLSGLCSFIGNILDDMNNENEKGEYVFEGIPVWLNR